MYVNLLEEDRRGEEANAGEKEGVRRGGKRDRRKGNIFYMHTTLRPIPIILTVSSYSPFISPFISLPTPVHPRFLSPCPPTHSFHSATHDIFSLPFPSHPMLSSPLTHDMMTSFPPLIQTYRIKIHIQFHIQLRALLALIFFYLYLFYR